VPHFAYTGRDERGQMVQGELEGASSSIVTAPASPPISMPAKTPTMLFVGYRYSWILVDHFVAPY